MWLEKGVKAWVGISPWIGPWDNADPHAAKLPCLVIWDYGAFDTAADSGVAS